MKELTLILQRCNTGKKTVSLNFPIFREGGLDYNDNYALIHVGKKLFVLPSHREYIEMSLYGCTQKSKMDIIYH